MWKIPPKKRSMRILHLIKPKLHFMFRGNINISLCYWQLPDNKFPIPEIAMKSGKKSIFLAFYRGLKIYFCCYFLEFFEKNILIFRKKYLNISKKISKYFQKTFYRPFCSNFLGQLYFRENTEISGS